jgi:hypothetical protein
MARGFCGTEDCSVLYEDFTSLGEGSTLESIITQASDWVYSVLAEMHRTPSSALPATGTSPNFWVRMATASESIYLAVARRMRADRENADGYWMPFHNDALGILEDFRTGAKRLDPEYSLGERGIGPAEPVENGTDTPEGSWVESNTLVPGCYYEDDSVPRTFTVELTTVGATLADCRFRWRTDENAVDEWESSGNACSWSFCTLAYGVQIRFFPANIASWKVGMGWTIQCYPERDVKERSTGGVTVLMERG